MASGWQELGGVGAPTWYIASQALTALGAICMVLSLVPSVSESPDWSSYHSHTANKATTAFHHEALMLDRTLPRYVM